MSGEFVNEAHNEVVEVERRLIDINTALTELSNWLYGRDPKHPLLDEISEANRVIEYLDFEAPYKDARAAAGEAWWDEA